MQSRQFFLRRIRTAIVALTSLAAVAFMLPVAAAAAAPNTLSPAVSSQKSLSANTSWSSAPAWSSVVTSKGDGPIQIQTTCTASVGPPIRLGNGNVTLDWSVTCDGQIRLIQGIVGILNSGGVPLGNTVDQFTITGSGGGNNITRPCAAGVLQGAMRARVTFLSGTPLVIEGLFFGPAASVC